MFDEITCEIPLPGINQSLYIFKTRDLECNLNKYRIDPSGYLWLIEESVVKRHNYEGDMHLLGKVPHLSKYYWAKFKITFKNNRVEQIELLKLELK